MILIFLLSANTLAFLLVTILIRIILLWFCLTQHFLIWKNILTRGFHILFLFILFFWRLFIICFLFWLYTLFIWFIIVMIFCCMGFRILFWSLLFKTVSRFFFSFVCWFLLLLYLRWGFDCFLMMLRCLRRLLNMLCWLI